MQVNSLTTGVKLGGNYIKYLGDKIVDPENAQEKLDEENAKDIYDGLKSLKGSALKVAQMLSMEKNLLPSAYVERFSLAQFSVPPLSGPLVRKTFKNILDSILKNCSIRLPLNLSMRPVLVKCIWRKKMGKNLL